MDDERLLTSFRFRVELEPSDFGGLEQLRSGQGAFAEESCSGTGTPMTKAAIETQLKAQGYTKIKEIKSHAGCYEAKGLDQNGKRFELEINSYTGKISNQEG